jgi:dihydropteroate synthase
MEDNLVILHRLNAFRVLGKPILVGASRKSFIGKILNNDVEERLRGTLAAITVARMNGAHVLRVHDVRQAKEALKITDAIMREGI